jgi:serine/threonine protein kinase
MDERSDLYFLGCILYHLISGTSPFLETKDKVKRMDRSRFFDIKAIQLLEPEIPGFVAALINKALMPHADQRYQRTGEMLHDLRNAAKRLEAGETGTSAVTSLRIGQQGNRQERIQKLQNKTVLIVDGNPKTMESLKSMMETLQFPTLCTNNPEEVHKIFQDNDLAAQCILFNGQTLGMRAIRALNDFSQYRGLREVGAILILDEGQMGWADSVTQLPNRVIMTMPITVEQFREVLSQIMER